jgi:hypothetical protein
VRKSTANNAAICVNLFVEISSIDSGQSPVEELGERGNARWDSIKWGIS